MNGYVVVREGNKPIGETEIADHDVLRDGFRNILDLIQR